MRCELAKTADQEGWSEVCYYAPRAERRNNNIGAEQYFSLQERSYNDRGID